MCRWPAGPPQVTTSTARTPISATRLYCRCATRIRDVSHGFIAYTRENIIRQAFKFLGERYGWGHARNARDCTGFVMEVYKTFGFRIPRNTGQQGIGSYARNTRFTSESIRAEKLQALKHLDIGDLIYVPGHVLMYIGDVDGEPYVIHDVSGFLRSRKRPGVKFRRRKKGPPE